MKSVAASSKSNKQKGEALEAHFKTPHFKILMATAEGLVAERGPDNKPFTAESLVMVSDMVSSKL